MIQAEERISTFGLELQLLTDELSHAPPATQTLEFQALCYTAAGSSSLQFSDLPSSAKTSTRSSSRSPGCAPSVSILQGVFLHEVSVSCLRPIRRWRVVGHSILGSRAPNADPPCLTFLLNTLCHLAPIVVTAEIPRSRYSDCWFKNT